MILLALGVLLLSALHLVPALPRLKAAVIARAGQGAYGPAFGAVAILAMALIVIGWRLSDAAPVYEPPFWGHHANFGLTFLAFLCLGVFLFRGKLRQALRFPMGIAVVLWSSGHLLANGDLRSVVLFGGLLLSAILLIGVGMAQGARPSPETRGGHDLLSLVMGAALYGVMTQLHPVIAGVPILSLTR
ncbi:MAG: hypothetical protein H7X89_04500 [Rhizobiales bacterium]|nr:hypothetical protein [Hyphomicrobiales bacterium]